MPGINRGVFGIKGGMGMEGMRDKLMALTAEPNKWLNRSWIISSGPTVWNPFVFGITWKWERIPTGMSLPMRLSANSVISCLWDGSQNQVTCVSNITDSNM